MCTLTALHMCGSNLFDMLLKHELSLWVGRPLLCFVAPEIVAIKENEKSKVSKAETQVLYLLPFDLKKITPQHRK